MLTIRVGKKRIKPFNWLIFLTFIFLFFYLVGCLIFLIPIFNDSYEYKIEKENYKINASTKFKHAWLKCHVKEEYVIKADNKLIESALEESLISDGFVKKNKTFVRKYSNFGICSDDVKKYKTIHKTGYVKFILKGKAYEKVEYEDDYSDMYVNVKINNVAVKNIDINSTLNEKRVGKYITRYSIKVSKKYTDYAFRITEIVDTKKPIIELKGDDEIILEYGSKYVEPGFLVTDNYDGEITNKTKIKNPVNTKKPGTYEISYKVCDTNNNCEAAKRRVIVKEKTKDVVVISPKIEQKDGLTYVDGVLLVNKKYGLPQDYDPGVNEEALSMIKQMQKDAEVLGLSLPIVSSYRSYKTQEKLHAAYAKKDGEEKASTYSAVAGHSEHQTGLAFDLGSTSSSFQYTNEAKWLSENAHLYGFIIRYPKDKTDVTGYIYEAWHVRYLGKELANKVWQSGLTLEEYLGVN